MLGELLTAHVTDSIRGGSRRGGKFEGLADGQMRKVFVNLR